MKKATLPLYSALVIVVMYYVTTMSIGCAQVGMPVGGPKDSLPPVLLNSTPPNYSTNFNTNRITLTFNEYIQLDNPLQNVLISPLPKKPPFIDFKLKNVTIKLYDTLQPGKTYSIQFGNTIRDLNENNPFKDFDYVYSTGNYIDSMKINGNVLLAESGTTDSTLTVLLYSDLSDSAVFKHKPEYISKLNKAGDFTFKNLSPGTYHIFALKDEGSQYIYNNPTQLFAFADSAINLTDTFKTSIRLFAYKEEKSPEKPATGKQDTTLTVTSNLKSGAQDLLTPLVLSFNHPLSAYDSSKILLTDTLFNVIPGVHYSLDTTGKQLSVRYDWQGSTDFKLLIPENAVTDTNNRHLAKTDTLSFKTQNETDYGSIKLTFKNLDKYQNPVLQLVSGKDILESYPLSSTVFQKKLIYPDTYHIQILEDRNKNGNWDPGNYSKRLQPEIVHRIEQTISIRANWDNERDIEL